MANPCYGLVATSAPLYIAPASTLEPPYREEYVYLCTACGAEVQDIRGVPLVGIVRHNGPRS